jgi:hypothetical protein
MEKVDFYSQLFEEIYGRVSKVCPEGAKDVAIKIIEEIAKDLRMEVIQSKAKVEVISESEEQLATKKQREALHKFGIKEIPENFSEILDKLVGFSKNGDSESITKLVEGLNAKWKKSQ